MEARYGAGGTEREVVMSAVELVDDECAAANSAKMSVRKGELVPDRERALKLIREINEWSWKAGAELRIDADGNLVAVVELK